MRHLAPLLLLTPRGRDGEDHDMTAMLDRAVPGGDAGVVTDGRPGDPDPEVPGRARRRTFTAKYKLEVLAAHVAAGLGEKGAILRRERLYSSHIVEVAAGP